MSSKTIVIAEAGVNHNGLLEVARSLIKEAAAAGADYIKFQTFSTEKLTAKTAPLADYQRRNLSNDINQFNMLKKLELSIHDHEILLEYCRQCHINFFSTAFDMDSIDLLARLGLNMWKVPSGELNNLPYLRKIGSFGNPVILSTGMATLGEIEEAINILETTGLPRAMITVLHCTTEYPAPIAEVNLKAMHTIANAFKVKVGYSDHTQGTEIALAAVALGAIIIEKHFTLDRDMPGPDHKSSLIPSELAHMIKCIRNIELSMGNGIKTITPSEMKNRSLARKSIVAAKTIKTGEEFSQENITTKRPGNGLSPMLWDQLIGSKAKRDYQVDDLIEL